MGSDMRFHRMELSFKGVPNQASPSHRNAVIKMMHTRRLLGFALVALLASSLVLPMSAYAAGQEQTKAEKFAEIAEYAYGHTLKLRDRARERGVDVKQANKLMGEGESLIREANASLKKGDYGTAFQKAREAQVRLRDSVKALGALADEAEEEKGRGILVAIDRAWERVQRLKDVIAAIASTPESRNYIAWVKGNLTEAEKNLTDAKVAVENKPANITEASRLLSDANKNIEEASRALKLVGDWTVTWRAEGFLNGVKKQLERVKNQLDRLAEKGVQVDDLKKVLTKMEELIQKARGRALAGDRRGALSDIKEVRDILQDILKDVVKRQRTPRGDGRGEPGKAPPRGGEQAAAQNLYALAAAKEWLEAGNFSEHHGGSAITLPANILYEKAP